MIKYVILIFILMASKTIYATTILSNNIHASTSFFSILPTKYWEKSDKNAKNFIVYGSAVFSKMTGPLSANIETETIKTVFVNLSHGVNGGIFNVANSGLIQIGKNESCMVIVLDEGQPFPKKIIKTIKLKYNDLIYNKNYNKIPISPNADELIYQNNNVAYLVEPECNSLILIIFGIIIFLNIKRKRIY